jgi:hypothetical protein
MQSRSTPGVITTVYLKQNTSYSVTVLGMAQTGTKAFVWIQDPLTKARLLPNYTLLPCSPNVASETQFKTPASANAHVAIGVGVLITGPKCGDQFVLDKITIAPCASAASSSSSSSGGAGLLVGDVAEASCSSSSNSSSSSSNSSSSSDSEPCENEYQYGGQHHRHPADAVKYTDPYYCCGSETPPEHERHEHEQHGPHYHSAAPHHTIPDTENTPVSIYDLQMSLGNMINQL